MSEALDPEDAKLVTLARGARGRVGARAGAGLRDATGRSYVAVDVRLTALSISALDLAVAQAVAAGADGVEAAVIVGEPPAADGLAALRELAGSGVPVLVCDAAGEVVDRQET
ncbi:MAG: cytidine deaminase [Actinomycetales bacterium]|nr:cytidine deaminase [Actinomycetales bacterium]